MTHDEIKAFIREKVKGGETLSRIQDELKEKGAAMTFMELRLIASEIEQTFWKEQEKKAPVSKEEKTAAPEKLPQEDFPQDDPVPEDPGIAQEQPNAPADSEKKLRGKTKVTISPIQRPGYVATGSVVFGSGASGDWCFDQMGRLGFERLDGKPDKQDLTEFQLELEKAFGA